MDSNGLNSLIDEFQHMIPKVSGMFESLRVHDWRPQFAKAKEIQAAFNSKVLYPTKSEREAAWVRFNDLRTLLHERANEERGRFRRESETLRDEILHSIQYAGYSRLTDVLFFFLPTTVEDMKQKGRTLKEAGQMLSRHKERMLKEHKDECFQRIQEVRSTHDNFWGEYKQHREARRAQFEDRRSEIVVRIRGNIRANGEKIAKAAAAYERVEANIEANLEKLAGARSSEFAERVSGWIEEDKEKLRSISDSIDRIKSWVDEDETRLRDLQSRR